MASWEDILNEEPKINWGDLLNFDPKAPALSSKIPQPSTLIDDVTDVDPLKFEVPKLEMNEFNKPIFTPELNVFRSYEEGQRQENAFVNGMVDYGLELYNNPLKVLTMTEDDGLFKPSKTKLDKKLKEQFGEDAITGERFERSLVEMKKKSRKALGDDWAGRHYQNTERSIDQSFDLQDNIDELRTQEVYSYVTSNGMFNDNDQKRFQIQQQIDAEHNKSIEERRDPVKIQTLRNQLNALGEAYTDEDGNVIDSKEATAKQQEYISMVNRYKETYSASDRDKLKEAFNNAYNFARAMDEAYEMDVAPWMQSELEISGKVPHIPYMTKDMEAIIDQRREAHAELTALSKLYLANSSPANVKKDFKFHAQDATRSLLGGFYGGDLYKGIKEGLGPSDRELLDSFQQVASFNGLPLTEEMQDTLDRSLLEYVNEGAFGMVGMLPMLSLAGRATAGLRTIKRFEVMYAGLKGGKYAKALGIVDKSNVFTKAAADIMDLGIEELKLQLIGFQPGSGVGFGVAGKITPALKLANPLANGLFQIFWKPATISSAVYLSRVVEAAAESLNSYKPFNDILQERFGDLKEVASVPLSMLMFGFGGFKKTTPEQYKGMETLAEKLKEQGDKGSADWLKKQIKTFQSVDKAVDKVKTKGKTPKEIAEEQDMAADQALAKQLAKEQVAQEDLGMKERTVLPEKIKTVLRNTKMKDKDGSPQKWYYRTNATFNIFSPREKGPSNVKSIKGLNWFSTDPEFGIGTNVQERYLNFKNPFNAGNITKFTAKKAEQIKNEGFDGVVGYVVKDGKRTEVAASFETQGVVRAEPSLDPFRERNTEIMRRWADKLRNTEINVRGLAPASILPIDLQKAAKGALNTMATILETAANFAEVIQKGFDYVKESTAYKKLSPELRATFDPEIRKRLQKALEDALPEATFKRDVAWAEEMRKDVKQNYFPAFKEAGEKLAEEHGGRFLSDIKEAESIATKKRRQGLMDIRDLPDVMRGAILLKDLKDFKAVAKQLKKEGYTLHNKRVPDKQSGYRGIYATKREGDLGVEIQLHTEKSWELQEKAHEIYKRYRDRNVEKPEIEKIEEPEVYIEDKPKKGSIDLSDTPESNKYSQPHSDYSEANGAAVHSNTKNLWIKPNGPASNKKRILMGQFTSSLMGTVEEQTNKASDYYTALYREVPGYHRTADFWEIPQWQAALSGSFKNTDSYIIRDIPEAVEFIRKSGYKEVAFSVLDVTKEHVKELAKQLPDVRFNIGGYIKDMGDFFKDTPNVKVYESIEEMAKDHKVPYTGQYDYRHFKNTKIIPRLSLSTGCKYRCAFCDIEKKVISVDKDIIDSQVEALKDFKADLIYLNDKTFGQASNYRYLEDVYTKLKEDNPNFQGFVIQTTALDFANRKKFDPEFLKKSGIRFVELGVETYNDDILTDLNKKHSHKKYVDEALNNARENGIRVIPNIIVGIEQETARSYENTLKFLKDNADIISHANIYSLAIYEGTELANEIAAKAESDRNENVVRKSFHTNPELHEKYLDMFLDWAKQQVEKTGPELRYQQDMAESRRLFDEAYAELEDIDMEGSPAPKPHEKKMRQLEIPVRIQKELKKAWTETKTKLLGELKGKNAEMKQAFTDFVVNNASTLTGLNIKLKPTMLKKVNAIDFTKPTSLNKALTYFENIINNATFRLDVLQTEKALNILDTKTADGYLAKKFSGVLKNKIGPSGLSLYDELKQLRTRMVDGDWAKGQEEIQKILDQVDKEGRVPTVEEMESMNRLGFEGLLNITNGAGLNSLKGKVQDLQDIIKTGRIKAAADKMFRNAQQTEMFDEMFKVLDGKPGKPVELDERLLVNKRATVAERLQAMFDWPGMSTFITHMDVLSKFDKTSQPFKSILNEVFAGSVVEANQNTFAEKRDLLREVEDKAADIFGSTSKRALRNNAKERTNTIHTIKYKDVMGVEKELPITMNQAYKVWMELQDPSLEKSHEAGGYMRNGELTELGKKIEGLLTPEVKEWAQWQLDTFYPKLYEILNPSFRSFYGVDMPYGQKYSPIFVQGKEKSEVNVDDLLARQTFVSSVRNGSLISRVNHAQPLRLMDGDKVLTSYIHHMMYWKNWTEPVQLLNTFVHDNKIRSAIKQNFGEDHLRVLQDDIDAFTRKPTDAWKTASWLGAFKNNFLVASLALKLPVGIKQLTSAPAYAEQIPLKNIPEYVAKTIANPKETMSIIKKIMASPYMQQRYQKGWDVVLTDIMEKDFNSLGAKHDWRHAMMFTTKYGDLGAILMGGVPYYRYEYDKAIKEFGPGSEKLAETRAMLAFADATRNAQQAGEIYDLSTYQRSNDFFKALTMYMTAPLQYHRKVAGAIRNWSHGRGDWRQHVKTIALYHVILPSIFQWASNGFKWDKEDQTWAAAIGNFNNLFIAGDIIDGIISTVRHEPWKKYQASPLLDFGSEVSKMAEHLQGIKPSTKKQLKGIPEDLIDQVLLESLDLPINYQELGKAIRSAAKVLGDVSGMPIHGALQIGEGIKDVIAEKNTEDKLLRILGWSKNTLKDAASDTDLDIKSLEEIQELMNDTKNPTLKKIMDKEEKQRKSSTKASEWF